MNYEILKRSVVVQLVEQSLLTPEIHGSHPCTRQILFTINCITNCFEKTKMKKKEAGIGPFNIMF